MYKSQVRMFLFAPTLTNNTDNELVISALLVYIILSVKHTNCFTTQIAIADIQTMLVQCHE